jgi:nucleotide-binding universal stress UspA family protein
VAIDFSQASNDALDAALELSRHHQGRLHLVHVVPDASHTPWMVEAAGIDFEELQQRFVADAEKQLVEFAASHNLDPLNVTTAVVVGPPATELVRYATDHAGNVIVLGSHGHGVVRRFLLGSVAERVLRQAACPVMVVPHRLLRLTPVEMKTASGVA